MFLWKLKCGTFHAFPTMILKDEYRYLGLGKFLSPDCSKARVLHCVWLLSRKFQTSSENIFLLEYIFISTSCFYFVCFESSKTSIAQQGCGCGGRFLELGIRTNCSNWSNSIINSYGLKFPPVLNAYGIYILSQKHR